MSAQAATSATPALAPRKTGTSVSNGPSEVVYTTPETRFNSVRLDRGSDNSGQLHLLGESYGAKLQCGICAGVSVVDISEDLRVLLSRTCGRLDGRVLIPQPEGVDIAKSKGVVIIGQYALPEKECEFLPSTSQDAIATLILEAEGAEGLVGQIEWLSVTLSTSNGEVTCRRVF